MTTRENQLRATALLWLLEHTEGGKRFMARLELGRRYRAAQAFYGRYERRAVNWCFASNLDRTTKSWRAVFRWWPDRGPEPTGTLVLEGGQGCGKTTAAVALLLRYGGEFVRAGDIGEIGLGDKGEDELDRLRLSRVLVLDNLGVEKDIGPTLSRIRSLLIYRDGRQLPTIITTTLAPDCLDAHGRPIPGVDPECTIAGRYEMDIVDRICGDGDWKDVDEPSRRHARIKPDMRRAEASAALVDLCVEVEKVKRGGGDPGAVDKLGQAAGIPDEQIRTKAAEAQAGMREALADLPNYLRESPIFARYVERWGVAPAES